MAKPLCESCDADQPYTADERWTIRNGRRLCLPCAEAIAAAASIFGALGGRATSKRKSSASRRNGKKGGRPKGKKPAHQ